MILAGIDEAGYGPLLGPLVVGCCAFEVKVDDPARLPCLWKKLRKTTSKNRCKKGKRLHVNDSKLVYSPSIGLKELERSILAVAGTLFEKPEELNAFLRHVAAHAIADLSEPPWYAVAADEPFPIEQTPAAVWTICNGLKAEMVTAGCACVHLAARVVPERPFNRMVHATRNKSNALFSISNIHIDHLLRTYDGQDLTIFCDRQGGRGYYGGGLRQMFEEWSLEIVSETDGRSEYTLERHGHRTRIIFCEKAEAQCMPVALASMLSKYLRESLMRRFNAYWKSHLPELHPTAGYYGDGSRFLNDIEMKRRELGIKDEDLIRCR